MKTYELTYIFSPELSLEEIEVSAKEIETAIRDKSGLIISQSSPNARTLAYPIKKQASGFITSLVFQMEEEGIKDIKEKINKEDKIVRNMIIVRRQLEKPRRRKLTERKETAVAPEKTTTEETKISSEKTPVKKVELRDIEQKIDEILGE